MTDALRQVVFLALKLGCTAFGGPAAHIAMLRDEAVVRRGWVTEARFLDLLGATNLIPGPNSTEMVMQVGRERAGWRGLWLAGVCFIVPAATITLGFAWLYARYGTTPDGAGLLRGVQPVIVAVVLQALWGLGQTAVRGPLTALLCVAVMSGYLIGINELVLLFGAGAVIAGGRWWQQDRSLGMFAAMPWMLLSAIGLAPGDGGAGGEPYQLSRLFWLMLKIGATLYGSGYVIVAFLRNDFVGRTGWLTERQLLDAVAVGQVTPGPVFTTATFVGYLVGGLAGALAATVAIFLPAFVLVTAIEPLIDRLRRSVWLAAVLDGINLGALGLMAAVSLDLGRRVIVDAFTVGLTVVTLVLLVRFRINSVWLIVVGGVLGILMRRIGL